MSQETVHSEHCEAIKAKELKTPESKKEKWLHTNKPSAMCLCVCAYICMCMYMNVCAWQTHIKDCSKIPMGGGLDVSNQQTRAFPTTLLSNSPLLVCHHFYP